MSSFIYRPDVYAMATYFSVENMCWCKISGMNDRKRKNDWPKMSYILKASSLTPPEPPKNLFFANLSKNAMKWPKNG